MPKIKQVPRDTHALSCKLAQLLYNHCLQNMGQDSLITPSWLIGCLPTLFSQGIVFTYLQLTGVPNPPLGLPLGATLIRSETLCSPQNTAKAKWEGKKKKKMLLKGKGAQGMWTNNRANNEHIKLWEGKPGSECFKGLVITLGTNKKKNLGRVVNVLVQH